MNNISINVYIPNVQRWFDIKVTTEATMEELKSMIVGLIQEELKGYVNFVSDTVICDYDEGFIYDGNALLKEIGIKNGERIMIV